jgi:chaperonin cofactor prefoldin
MSKVEKKKEKLKERIKTLQDEMVLALTKKTSTTKEISIPTYQRQIAELQSQLQKM